MKNTLKTVLIIVFCCFAVACSTQKTEIYKKLEIVDMMSREDKYDTAISILDSLSSSQLTECESALYNLLLIRLHGTHNYADVFDSIINISERYFKSTDDIKHLSETYLLKGFGFFTFHDQIDSCIYFFDKGSNLAESIQDNFLLSQAYWYKIHLYMWIGDIKKVQKMAEMQCEYANKAQNQRQLAYAALNKSTIQKEMGDTAEAIMNFNEALIHRKFLRANDIVFIYSGLGELTINSNIEAAKTYFENALKIDPDSKLLKKDLALLKLKQGNINEAVNICPNYSENVWSEDKIDLLKIQLGCKMAENNLSEVINLQNTIISEKDSIIKRIQDNMSYCSLETPEDEPKSDNQILLLVIIIPFVILLIIAIIIILRLRKKQQKSKEQIKILEYELSTINNELATEKELNKKIKHPGKELYDKIMEGKDCSQWNKPEMVCFLELYNVLYPEIVEKIDSEYENLSARDKIILILLEIGKPKEEILKTLGLSDSCYQTTMSRIKTKNANT